MVQNKKEIALENYKKIKIINFTILMLGIFILMFYFYRVEYFVTVGLLLIMVMLLVIKRNYIKLLVANDEKK